MAQAPRTQDTDRDTDAVVKLMPSPRAMAVVSAS